MKLIEIRALSTDELKVRLNDTQEELMKLRFQLATGGLTDHTRLSQTRQTIARLMTILRERQVTEQEEGQV